MYEVCHNKGRLYHCQLVTTLWVHTKYIGKTCFPPHDISSDLIRCEIPSPSDQENHIRKHTGKVTCPPSKIINHECTRMVLLLSFNLIIKRPNIAIVISYPSNARHLLSIWFNIVLSDKNSRNQEDRKYNSLQQNLAAFMNIKFQIYILAK